jgi:6-phosphogluconate dehydrogenase
MQIGIVGLGRMGLNMSIRLIQRGHSVVGTDVSPEKQKDASDNGLEWANTVPELILDLAPPRVVWMMVPAGDPVDHVIASVVSHASKGDILIDGGNSYYKDTLRRSKDVTAKGFHYLDAGTSGGVWGLENGYCLMIGGDEDAFRAAEPIFRDLAPENGYRRVGPSGAGHFAKMVHNGIEYGMLEAYGEGFEILRASGFQYDLAAIAHLWNQGGVVRSWLLELAELAFRKSPDLADIKGFVQDSGEGRWTVSEAIDKSIPIPVIALSLLARFRSRQEDSFSAKVIAALRNEFGGHAVEKE